MQEKTTVVCGQSIKMYSENGKDWFSSVEEAKLGRYFLSPDLILAGCSLKVDFGKPDIGG